MACADCGCLVEAGVRVSTCAGPGCCCSALPTSEALADIDMAAQVRGAFESRDPKRFGALLADDARWGDDDAPNKCRSRAEVVETFQTLIDEGVGGESSTSTGSTMAGSSRSGRTTIAEQQRTPSLRSEPAVSHRSPCHREQARLSTESSHASGRDISHPRIRGDA